MSEGKDIFSRWSQRKRDVAASEAEQKTPPAAVPAQKPAAPGEAGSGPAEALDLSKLPSIDSITAQTDIRDFLRPGIPAALRDAALRRAWVADPAIRDFIGLSENQWDFNKPETIPGFGPIGPQDKVEEMVARMFGKSHDEPAPQVSEVENKVSAQTSAPPEATAPPVVEDIAPEKNLPATDVASHQNDDDEPTVKPRRHGGALPT